MDTEEQVVSIIRSNLEDKCTVTLGTRLRTELRLDSFGILMIINGLEEGFGINLQEEDFKRVNTVSDVVALVREKLVTSHIPGPVWADQPLSLPDQHSLAAMRRQEVSDTIG